MNKNNDNSVEDVENEVDKVVGKSEQVQKAFDNIVFRNNVQKNPLMLKHYARGLTVEYIDLGPFLKERLWTRSIYTTDKLIRLNLAAPLEMMKKYLEKKRKAAFDFMWLILIIVGVLVAVLVAVMLLPKLFGGG